MPDDENRDAASDHLAGLLLAIGIVIAVFTLGYLVFGNPPPQDCVRERHGKGAYTMRCVER